MACCLVRPIFLNEVRARCCGSQWKETTRLIDGCLLVRSQSTSSNYIQGQYSQEGKRKVREYFYYVDHHGMLFLDDVRMKNFTSCFKEKKFLQFFFRQLRMNDTGRYEYFPYLSPCGPERNYVRCDDVPIVFTHILQKGDPGDDLLSYGHAGELLTVKFEPQHIYMLPNTGRVYYPASEKVGGVGLIKSSLAIELSRNFIFEQSEEKGPSAIVWRGKEYKLTNMVAERLQKLQK